MRIAGIVVLISLALAACKNNGDAAPDPNAKKAQEELIARRDALLKQRQSLEADRDKLDDQIKDAEAKGSDTTELKKKRAELDTQLESRTNDLITSLSSKIEAAGDKAVAMASREAEISSRERTLADREARLAERERQLAQRESEAAQRWKDSCSMTAPMIIQAPAKGGNYGKKDVADVIGRAHAAMAKKGILTGDLPGPAQSLEAESAKAMNENDFSKAYFAAMQLAGQVEAIQINRAFIQAKTARLQAQIKASTPDAATSAQLDGILRDVMVKYNDGDFSAANKRLNQLAAALH